MTSLPARREDATEATAIPADSTAIVPADRLPTPAATVNMPPAESAWILLAVPNTPPHPPKWMVAQLAADSIEWSRNTDNPNLWVRMTARLRRDRSGLDFAQFVKIEEALAFLKATRGRR